MCLASICQCALLPFNWPRHIEPLASRLSSQCCKNRYDRIMQTTRAAPAIPVKLRLLRHLAVADTITQQRQ